MCSFCAITAVHSYCLKIPCPRVFPGFSQGGTLPDLNPEWLHAAVQHTCTQAAMPWLNACYMEYASHLLERNLESCTNDMQNMHGTEHGDAAAQKIRHVALCAAYIDGVSCTMPAYNIWHCVYSPRALQNRRFPHASHTRNMCTSGKQVVTALICGMDL